MVQFITLKQAETERTMGIIKKKEAGEFDLDNDYFINRVDLKKTEEEHTHKFIEMVYTLSGKGVHKIDDREYHVKGGDMLLINYHCRHTVTPIGNLSYVDIMLKPEYVNETLKGTEDVFLLLHLSDFSDLSSRIIKDNLLLHFDGEEKKRIEMLLDWTQEEQRSSAPAGELIIYSALSMLLSVVFRKMTENQSARASINDQLLAYIERNCGDRLLINEIAAKCGYTVEHFSRIFKAYTGKPPVAYIKDCRMKKAKRMLVETDKSIDTIISECGISNRTEFFKSFYERFGATPLKYRKNQK